MLITKARFIIFSALKVTERAETFLYRLEDTFFQIKFIQNKFRNLRQIMQQRRDALRYNLLQTQTFFINNALLKTKDEKNK